MHPEHLITELFEHFAQICFVFFGGAGIVGHGGRVKLTPDIVDTDADGNPLRMQVDDIAVESCLQIAAGVAGNAGVGHTQEGFGIRNRKEIFNDTNIAVAQIVK